jgi:hypothetical protein
MKHLKLFNDTVSYETWKNSEGFVLPNVSYVVETEGVSYEPYVQEMKAGDIAYWDGQKVKITSADKWSSSLGTPVGIVVIPKGFAPDGKTRIISLKWASTTDTYANSEESISWGYADGNLKKYDVFPQTSNNENNENSYILMRDPDNKSKILPSDYFTSGYHESYIDPLTKYATKNANASTRNVFVPSPYITKDGEYKPNEEYYKDYTEDGYNNALSDFDGLNNTIHLVNLDSSKFQAAFAAYNYDGGIQNTNIQWYLPSAGELGYLCARYKAIETSNSLVGGKYFDPKGKVEFASSTETGRYGCVHMTIYTPTSNFGTIHSNYDDKGSYLIRPFAIID